MTLPGPCRKPAAVTIAIAVALAMAVLLLGGCAAAPVQEMSDARQAIMAAEQSGAEEHAPEQLNQARNLLARAEQNLKLRSFELAREEAVQARARATEALYLADAARRVRRD